MKYLSYLFLCLIALTSCFKSNNQYWVDGWKSYPVTDIDTIVKDRRIFDYFLRVYSKSDSIFVSYYDNPTVPFELTPNTKQESRDFKGQISITSVTDGYLLGFDYGEFNGSLYWFSKNGEFRYKVSDDQVVQFQYIGHRLYAIEGLTHGGMSVGSIIEIKYASNRWQSHKFLTLSSAPRGIAVDKRNNFIVACSDNLLRISPSKRIDTLVSKTLWQPFSPTSIVIKDNYAYVGMYKCVYRFNLSSRKQELLLNNKLNFVF